MRNVSFLLLYSKVLKSAVLSNMPQYHQTTGIWSLKLEKIRSLCKKLMESQKVIKIKNPSKSVKKPQSGLWNWKTLEIFERN